MSKIWNKKNMQFNSDNKQIGLMWTAWISKSWPRRGGHVQGWEALMVNSAQIFKHFQTIRETFDTNLQKLTYSTGPMYMESTENSQ